jgi:dihydrofolate reductase
MLTRLKEKTMRKIVASEYISLDGIVEAGWTGRTPALSPADELTSRYFNAPKVGKEVGALGAAADTLLLGRVTYEGFAAFFAGQAGGMADQMNAMRKIVISSTLDKADWQNTTVVNTSPRKEITALKQLPGKNINVSGSATLVRWLLREHLLDELHLLVFPVVMGGGTRLFAEGSEPADLGSNACTSLGNGVLHLEYHPSYSVMHCGAARRGRAQGRFA